MFSLKFLLVFVVILVAVGFVSAQCPSITVRGPQAVIMAGDEVSFRVEVGAAGPRLSYSWALSAGTMIQGQGTPEITIQTDASMRDTNLTATVGIDGIPLACDRSASATAPVTGIGCGLVADEWANLKPNDIRSRLDTFFADLSNNPTHTGVVWLIVAANEPMDLSNKRLQLILRHISFRKFDRSRMWFQLELGDDVRTKVYRMPPGAKPLCEKCLTIKGSDIQ